MSNHIFFFCINNSVGSRFSGEIFLNLNLNRVIRLFCLLTHDRLQTKFEAARRPSVRAGGSVNPSYWTTLNKSILNYMTIF